jgi:hypothetical protein
MPTKPAKKKPAAPLKEFISYYTAPEPDGKNARIAFNKKPKPALDDYGVEGDGLAAFLSFDEPTISAHVFKETIGKNWTPGTAADFSAWLTKFANWYWPTTEGHLYEQPLCNSGSMTPAYPKPKCHLRKDSKATVHPSPVRGKRKVDLAVKGEGFLPGASIECVNVQTKAVVKTGAATFDSQSTFRCSLLRATVQLAPGKYRLRVLDPLGSTGIYTIETTKDGKPVEITVS